MTRKSPVKLRGLFAIVWHYTGLYPHSQAAELFFMALAEWLLGLV